MKKATSLLLKVRSAARRRLLLDEARRWAFVASLLALSAQIVRASSADFSGEVKIVLASLLFLYTLLRSASLRRRLPTLYQTARRLETCDPKLQGVLSGALDFESEQIAPVVDSKSLRDATIDQAKRRLEIALSEGRLRELRDVVLQRTPNARNDGFVFLETIGTACAVLALVVNSIRFAPGAQTPASVKIPTTDQTTTRDVERTIKTPTDGNDENVTNSDRPSPSFDDAFAFLRSTLARSVSLADSLTRELRDASHDSFDSTSLFQLAREFDASLTSSSGLIASVRKTRASSVALDRRDVDVLLSTRRLREFDEYLRANQNVGAELTRLFATATRSFSSDVRDEALTGASETLKQIYERLQTEERALDFLAFGREFSRRLEELNQERAALLQEAVERLRARPGAFTDVDSLDLPTNDFLVRLDKFEERWNARCDELEETARRLREPDAGEFVAFATRFAEQTDSVAFLLGTETARADLARRFDRPLATSRQIARDARAERWGKVATALSGFSRARDMLGAETRETNDVSSTLAWRLAFGAFDGINDESTRPTSNSKEPEAPTFSPNLEPDVAISDGKNRDALQRMARAEESASELTLRPDEARTSEKIRAELEFASRSNKASEEESAPDENYAGGAGSRETTAPIANGTDAFRGELPDVAPQRLQAGKRWNPPREYREKERAFQARLRAETRKNR